MTNNKKTSNNIDLKVVLAKFQNLEKLYLDSRCMIYIIEENNLLANLQFIATKNLRIFRGESYKVLNRKNMHLTINFGKIKFNNVSYF